MKATHKVTIVEAVDFAKLAREEASKKTDMEKTFIDIVMDKSTVSHIYDLISADVERNASNPKELLKLANTSKDAQFNELTADIMNHITAEHTDWWINEQKENKSDMSSADGSDNR